MRSGPNITKQTKPAIARRRIKTAITTVQSDQITSSTTRLTAYSTTITKSGMVQFCDQFDNRLRVTE